MKTTHGLTALGLAAALAIGLAGCKGEDKLTPAKAGGQAASQGHDHSSAIQHGGSLVEVGNHAALLEITHDETTGTVRLWAYAMDGSAISLDEPPVLNVPGDEPKQLTGAELEGAWTFQDEALAGHVHGARLRVSVRGVPYSPALPDVH